MSTLWFSSESANPTNIQSILDDISFVKQAIRWQHKAGPVTINSTRVDDIVWGPTYDPDRDIYVAVGGRPALDTNILQELAKDGPREGFIARQILKDFIAQGADSLTRLNGAFAILIWDGRKNTLTLATDRLGVFPVYAYRQREPRALHLCTHADVLAKHLPRSPKLNLGTMAMALSTGGGHHPHTYYEEIELLEPASLYTWNLSTGRFTSKAFWRPTFELTYDLNAAAEQLAASFKSAIQRRTHSVFGRPSVLLSGGSDSRICLFGLNDPSTATTFTLCDSPNSETATAKALADLAGANSIIFERPLDYYPDSAVSAIRIGGGQWNFWDAHYTGFQDQIFAASGGTLLTGCYADYMFKGLLQNRSPLRVLGVDLPVYRLAKQKQVYYLGRKRLVERWNGEVEKRLYARVDQASLEDSSESGRLSVEIKRLSPLSIEPDFLSRICLWRTLPWDHYLSDSDVINAYLRLGLSLKLNGEAYGRAASIICSRAASVPNANSGVRVDATPLELVAAHFRRTIRNRFTNSGENTSQVPWASSGSWPNWSYVIEHSPSIKRQWPDIFEHGQSMLAEFLPETVLRRSLAEWSTDVTLFTRVFSLLLWYKHRIQ